MQIHALCRNSECLYRIEETRLDSGRTSKPKKEKKHSRPGNQHSKRIPLRPKVLSCCPKTHIFAAFCCLLHDTFTPKSLPWCLTPVGRVIYLSEQGTSQTNFILNLPLWQSKPRDLFLPFHFTVSRHSSTLLDSKVCFPVRRHLTRQQMHAHTHSLTPEW